MIGNGTGEIIYCLFYYDEVGLNISNAPDRKKDR